MSSLHVEEARAPLRPSDGALGPVIALLQRVEALPSDATGALAIGDRGAILVECGRVCWAVVPNVRTRLSELLSHESERPLAPSTIDALLRRCTREARPIGDALLASGIVSEAGLQRVLARQTGEAIAQLATCRGQPSAFRRHTHASYEPRFVFSTAKLLSTLSWAEGGSRVCHAEARLAQVLVPGAWGAAFLASGDGQPGARLLAVDPRASLCVADALELGALAQSLLEVAARVDPTVALASASWCPRTAVVAWRERELTYAALCESRPASARLMAALSASDDLGSIMRVDP